MNAVENSSELGVIHLHSGRCFARASCALAPESGARIAVEKLCKLCGRRGLNLATFLLLPAFHLGRIPHAQLILSRLRIRFHGTLRG
jgi:hypothetical protein